MYYIVNLREKHIKRINKKKRSIFGHHSQTIVPLGERYKYNDFSKKCKWKSLKCHSKVKMSVLGKIEFLANLLTMKFSMGAFRAPAIGGQAQIYPPLADPTTNPALRDWTKKSFFSASRAISRIIFLSRLVWFYCFHKCIEIGWIYFFLVGYIARSRYCGTGSTFWRCIVTSGVFVLYYKTINITYNRTEIIIKDFSIKI